MASQRFTASAHATVSQPPSAAAPAQFSRSAIGARGPSTISDRGATLKKLEALRAVAKHAQEAELTYAFGMWADAILDAPSTPVKPSPVQVSSPQTGMAIVSSSDVAGSASGLVKQAAAGRRTLRLLEALRAVVQRAEGAESLLKDAFASWRELPPRSPVG